MLSEIIQKVAENNGIPYEEAYKIISLQFKHVRQAFADSEVNSVEISKLGTFTINKKVLQKRLNALVNYKHKKKYIHDEIENLLKKGVTPYI